LGEDENLYLSVHAYRGGRCQRIYGSATRELRQALSSLERGEALMPILCRRLRDRQEYLHGTYAEKIFIPTRAYQDTYGERLPEPLIMASGGANLFTSFENRLLRTFPRHEDRCRAGMGVYHSHSRNAVGAGKTRTSSERGAGLCKKGVLATSSVGL